MGRKKAKSKKSINFLVFVLIILIGVVSVQISRLYNKNYELEAEAIELQAEIDNALKEQEELLEYKEYMLTTEYIEYLAREKIGLVKPNEIIFKSK